MTTAPHSAHISRTQITYPRQVGGNTVAHELPFVILVIAPLTPGTLGPLTLTQENFASHLAALLPGGLSGADGASDSQSPAQHWRNLQTLVSEIASSPLLKLRVLSASPSTLSDDIGHLQSVDRSQLDHWLNEARWGVGDCEPISLIVADLAFSPDAVGQHTLNQLARLANKHHAGLIASTRGAWPSDPAANRDGVCLCAGGPSADISASLLTQTIARSFALTHWPVPENFPMATHPGVAHLVSWLCAARFAHTLCSIVRDAIGSFLTRAQLEEHLSDWLRLYLLLDDDAPSAVQARLPLREARIRVADEPGCPGCYRAQLQIASRYQRPADDPLWTLNLAFPA